MDPDEFLNKRIARIARDRGACTVDEVNAELDALAIELDDDRFLKRTLAIELRRLDELEDVFHPKATLEKAAAAGALLVKIHEMRTALLDASRRLAEPPSPSPGGQRVNA
jgi:hypothetical protein